MFVLVTGGSGSGKSEYAERILAARPEKKDIRYYIATMMPYGEEGRKRVEKHRRQRAGRSFRTIERYLDLQGLRIEAAPDMKQPGGVVSDIKQPESVGLSVKPDVLLECMSNLVANEMFDEGGSHEGAACSILAGVKNLLIQTDYFVIVTNDVFSDGTVYDPETMNYLKCLGDINRELAKLADCVVEVVCGIPICLKGELPCV